MFAEVDINEVGKEKIKKIELEAARFYLIVSKEMNNGAVVGNTREFALFVTRLQEAVYWAHRGIAIYNEVEK